MSASIQVSREHWNGLYHGHHSEDVEYPDFYKPGGYHPVHIGDEIGDEKKYRIINKLCFQTASEDFTVWLDIVCDTLPTQYVVIKIRMAVVSNNDEAHRKREIIGHVQEITKSDPAIARYCLLPLDQFQFESPNGIYQCFVSPAAGPQAKEIYKTVNGDPAQFLRNMANQVAETVAALHRHGICHRDEHNALNGMSQKEVVDLLGEPLKSVFVSQKAMMDRPEWLFQPLEYWDSSTPLVSEEVCLIDFGGSFIMPNPAPIPVKHLCYSAPEYLLENKSGPPSDIWSPACNGDLHEIVKCLGPFPEPWRSMWEYHPEPKLEVQGGVDWEQVCFSYHPSLKQSDERSWADGDFSEDEKVLFIDLLSMMLKYDPNERPTAEQVLKHPWLSFGAEKSTE